MLSGRGQIDSTSFDSATEKSLNEVRQPLGKSIERHQTMQE